MLQEISEAGTASPLAVIKKTGPGRAGYMSFPMEGITLAVDLPNRSGTGKLLTKLNRMALDHGGRVYLAKDSSADRDTIAAMYSERDAYAEAVAQADPEAKFMSAMSARLDLRGRA